MNSVLKLGIQHRRFAAISTIAAAAMVNTAGAQEGMIYTAVNIGGTTSQEVKIYQNGTWNTLFTRPFCTARACTSLIQNLAVDENARRVYWMNGNVLEYWHVDTHAIAVAVNDVLPPGQLIRSMAFNPDTGLLYAIKRAPTAATEDEMISINPSNGAIQSIMIIDDEFYRFSTLDYNRTDNTFYAYHTGAGSNDAAEGLYKINVLGDQSITVATSDPWGPGVAVGATVKGDELYIVRAAGSPFPSQKGTISTAGPPWSDFSTPPSPSGTERATAFAWWLFPQEPACAADIADGGDGVVDVFDLFVLLSNWGTSGTGADLAEPNNVVDVFDLFELLSSWGPCE